MIEDLSRWLSEMARNEELARTVKEMGLEAFRHYVQHALPHLWDSFKDHIVDLWYFVSDWLSNLDWGDVFGGVVDFLSNLF